MNSNIRDLTRIIQPAPMNKKILLFLIVFCFLFINSTVFAATYYVDTINGTNQVGCGSAQGISACKTIQYTETNVLSDNDTAYVAAGTYQEAYSSSYGLILGKAVIWIASGTVIITSSSQRSTAILYLNTSKAISMTGFTIDAGTSIATPYGLYQVSANHTFNNCIFQGAGWGQITTSAPITITGGTIYGPSNNSRVGITLSAADGTGRSTIQGVTFILNIPVGTTGNFGIYVTGSGDALIDDNIFTATKWPGSLIYVASTGANGNLSITNNRMTLGAGSSTSQGLIVMTDCITRADIFHNTIISNEVSATGSPLIRITSSNSTPKGPYTITNNELTFSSDAGYLIGIGSDTTDSAGNYSLNGITIKNNILTSPATSHVHNILYGHNNNGIIENNIISGGTYGIVIKGSSTGVGGDWTNGTCNNNIVLNTLHGIHISGVKNVKAYNNTVYSSRLDSTVYGFYIMSNEGQDSTGIVLKNNIISVNDSPTYYNSGIYAGTLCTLTSDYNNIYLSGYTHAKYGQSGNPTVVYDGWNSGTKRWVADGGYDVHGINVAPLFVNPGTDLNLQSVSSAIDGGTDVSLIADYKNNTVYGTPDIGAYEYQPPHVMGTDKINVVAGARIYGDGTFRDVSATSTAETNLIITPQSGSFPVYDAITTRPEWLDVSAITWATTGDRHKAWTESSDDPTLTDTLHTVGDLEAGKYYNIAVDGTVGLNMSGDNCTAGLGRADSYGKITFKYTGHYTTHTFDVSEGDNVAPTITSITSINNSGAYKAGQTIQLNINFSEAVNATSSVNLLLNTTPERGCTFTVSNSATSTCDYIVQDGDNAATLNVASISGTIKDLVDNPMTNFTPAANLSASKAIVIDTTAPTVSISSFPIVNNANQNGVTVSGVCTENGLPVSLTIGSVTATPTCSSGAWSTTVDLHGLSDGTLTADVSQTDVAGNIGSNSLTSTKDTGDPAVTGLSNDSTPRKAKTWSWSYGEESATFRYAIDQILAWAATGDFATTTTATQSSGNGTYYLHVQAQDGAGNVSAVATVSAVLDNTAPVITVSGDNPVTIAQGSAYTDGGAAASDNIDSSVTVIASGTVDTAALGDYTISYDAADVAGNAATPATRLVHVTDQTASTISELSNDSTPRKTKIWTWSGEAGDTFRFVVDRNATTTLEGEYGDFASATQAGGNGTYYLHVQSKDAANNESEVVTVFAILDNNAPTITITDPNTDKAQSKILTAITSDGLLTMSITTGSVCDGSLTFVSYADHTFVSESDNGKKICYKAIDTAANAAYQISEAIGGIDVTPPSILELADDLARAKSKTWNWSGEAETTFRFAIDQNPSWTAIGEYGDVATVTQAGGNGIYYLHVQSKDAANNESEVVTVFALLDNTAPTITETAATASRTASAISWTTGEAASSKVEYGLTDSYGEITEETDIVARVTGHSVNLSGLDACSTYHYRAISKDGAGNEAIGGDETFKTECGSSQKPSYGNQAQVSSQIQNIQQEIARLQSLLGMANAGNALGNKYSCAAIVKNLYFGMANDPQVYCLQEFLTGQGVAIYPEARITGNFYQMTKAAVIRFQEKHQSDILTPFRLTHGNGFVGLKTRQAINQLIGN